MGVNQFNMGEVYDPDILSSAIEYESVQGGFWSRFCRENWVRHMGRESVSPIGSIEKQGSMVTVSGGNSGAPIETLQHFEDGGTQSRVPLRQRYIGSPRSGRSAMQGTGEGVRWLWRTLTIWNIKKAFALLSNGPDAQVLRKAMADEINGNVRKAAGEWMRDWEEGNIPHTLLTGYSAELTPLVGLIDARTDVEAFSHGNIFVAGHGQVPQGTTEDDRPGSEGYEDNLVSIVDSMMAKDPADVGMTARRLVAFRDSMQALNIPTVNTPYGPLYLVVMKSSQYRQLSRDPEYRQSVIDALPRDLKSHPLFAGAVAIYEHCIIFVEPTLFGIQTSGGKVVRNTASSIGIPSYGPAGSWMARTGQASSYDTNECAIAYGFGGNMMSRVYGKVRIEFTDEVWDHGQKKELGMKAWKSLLRNDKFDIDGHLGYGANSFAYNDTSALLITRSPYGADFK